MRRGQEIINQEVTYSDNQELVSTTDLRGVITYVNKEFCAIAGYSEEELLGKNHNIVRHPDMPKAAFKEMWEKLKQGHSWRGMVKNRCKVNVLGVLTKSSGHWCARMRPFTGARQ